MSDQHMPSWLPEQVNAKPMPAPHMGAWQLTPIALRIETALAFLGGMPSFAF